MVKAESKSRINCMENYFYGKHETNDILNEINRMNGIIGDMIRPVGGDYLVKLKERKQAMEKEHMSRNVPPPMRM